MVVWGGTLRCWVKAKSFVYHQARCFSLSSRRLNSGRLSYFHQPGLEPLAPLTIGQLIDKVAHKSEDCTCLVEVETGKRKTFQQIKMEVTVNPALQAREIVYCLNKVEMKGLVTARQFRTQDYHKILLTAVPELDQSKPGELKSKVAPNLSTVIGIGTDVPKSYYSFEEVFNGGGSEAVNKVIQLEKVIQPDDPCNIQFTSGTTGQPKAATLSHHGMVNNAYVTGRRLRFRYGQERLCVTVPFFHCYGNVAGILLGLHHASSVVMPSPGFDPKLAVQAAHDEKCTIMYGTPTMHVDMLKQVDDLKPDLSSMYGAVTGGAICPLPLIVEMKEKFNVKWAASIYGMTETSPVSLQSNDTDPIEKLTKTVGYVHDNLEVKAIDPNGHTVPIGTPGELCVRGYSVMLGYWGDPEKTKEAISPCRWLRTGDQVVFDEDGYASIVGRIKDVIIRGGENIFPKEVEEFLHENPKIMEANVVGLPDKRMGEVVCAWVRLHEGQSMTSDELRASCKGQLASFKIPKYVHFTQDFPKTPSGKVQKFKIQELSIDIFKLDRS